MSELITNLEAWLAYLSSIDRAPTFGPPATTEQIQIAERFWGYEFGAEVRALYTYGNGTDPKGYPLLHAEQHLVSLSEFNDRRWRLELRSNEGFFDPKGQGNPCFSVPIICDHGWSMVTGVVCDDLAHGAVWSRGEDGYWEARTLADLFARLVDYAERGLYVVNDTGFGFTREEVEGRRWIWEPSVQDEWPNNWRWEPVAWRTAEEQRMLYQDLPW